MIFDGTHIPRFATVIIIEILRAALLRAPLLQVAIYQLAQDGDIFFPFRAVPGARDPETLRRLIVEHRAYFLLGHVLTPIGEDYTLFRAFAQDGSIVP